MKAIWKDSIKFCYESTRQLVFTFSEIRVSCQIYNFETIGIIPRNAEIGKVGI